MRDKKAIDFFSNKVVLAKVKAKVDTVLAANYNIVGYPTSVLVHADGNEVDRIIGYVEVDEYLKTISDYQQGIGTLSDLHNKIEANFTREMAFEIGDKYKYKADADNAVIWFNKVIEAGDPRDSISAESRLAIAGSYYRSKDFDRAITEYDKIMSEFKGLPAEENAAAWAAYLVMEKDDSANAISRFEDFIKKFPESEDIEFAKESLAKLKGLPFEKE